MTKIIILILILLLLFNTFCMAETLDQAKIRVNIYIPVYYEIEISKQKLLSESKINITTRANFPLKIYLSSEDNISVNKIVFKLEGENKWTALTSEEKMIAEYSKSGINKNKIFFRLTSNPEKNLLHKGNIYLTIMK